MFKLFLQFALLSLILSSAKFAYCGDAAIFSGSNIKTLKSNLDLNGGASIQTGTTNPTSSAVSANAGSLYLNTSSGVIYSKNDNGSSTNWTALPTGAATGGNPTLIADGYWAGAASSCTWSRASSTLGALNGGTMTNCNAFTVVRPTTPPYSLSSSSASFPALTVTSLPAGTYEVDIQIAYTGTNGAQTFIGVNDGTNTYGVASFETYSALSAPASTSAYFTYGSSGTKTFTIYVAVGTGTFTVGQNTTLSGGGPVRMTITKIQ